MSNWVSKEMIIGAFLCAGLFVGGLAVAEETLPAESAAPASDAAATAPQQTADTAAQPDGAGEGQADAATQTAAADGAAASSGETVYVDDTKIVCKSIKVTGSRVKREKVCMTKGEWRRQEVNASRSVNRMKDGNAGASNSQ